jgi:hypothetical protein
MNFVRVMGVPGLYILDIAFRVVAVAGLLLVGFLSRDRILMLLGIFIAFEIPVAFRIARIATLLRNQGVPPASEDDQTIPAPTAQLIIAELKKAGPKAVTTKVLADQTMQVFETLNASPPGWVATAGLLLVYGVSLVLALVFAVLLAVGPTGPLSPLA